MNSGSLRPPKPNEAGRSQRVIISMQSLRHSSEYNLVFEYYMIIPIDDTQYSWRDTPLAKLQMCGFRRGICQPKSSRKFQSIHPTSLDQVHCSNGARKYSKTLPGSLDLSPLAAGESRPLGQSCATEIGICIGNCPICLPGQFEILSGSRASRANRTRRSRSQMIVE
jgi:hypothetical protein